MGNCIARATGYSAVGCPYSAFPQAVGVTQIAQEAKKMKKLGYLLGLVAIALTLGENALAQGDKSVYFTTYYSNALTAGPDETIRIINDGDTGGTLWASFYVFDDSEELQDCCSCPISADGLLSESVNNQLASFDLVLTPEHDYRGVIKIIASSTPAFGPSFTNTPAAGLHGFATHTQSAANKYPFGAAPYSVTESLLQDSNLSSSEKTLLETLCYYSQQLGSGEFGYCTCTPEDRNF
jgi:hypothetical protein